MQETPSAPGEAPVTGTDSEHESRPHSSSSKTMSDIVPSRESFDDVSSQLAEVTVNSGTDSISPSEPSGTGESHHQGSSSIIRTYVSRDCIGWILFTDGLRIVPRGTI